MASDTLEVIIRSKGGEQVVAQFKNISGGAQQMGTAVEQAGQKATTGADRFNKAWAAASIAAGTAAQVLGEWSRSSQDAEAIQRQLEAAIAATGEQYATYAERVSEAGARAVQLGQDDEAASQAIAALTEITGSANVALNEMGLVMDLAAAKHMSLENAAELIGKVYEGNTTILQRYGIVVEQGATAEQALAQIQSQVAGQAEAHATTYARLREEVSNVTDAIGGAVGGFAPFLAMLPGLSVGVTAATGAIGALVPEMTAAGAASAALDLALGPIGIVLAAGAAAVAIYELTKGSDDYAEAAEQAQKASVDLTTALRDLAAAGSPEAAIGTAWKQTLDAAAAAMPTLEELSTRLDDVTDKLQKEQEAIAGTSGKEQAMHQANIDSLSKEKIALQDAIRARNDYAEASQALIDVLTDTGTGAELAMDATRELFQQFAQDHNTSALIEGLVKIDQNLGAYDVQANKAATSTNDLKRAMEGLPPADTPGLWDRLKGKIDDNTEAAKKSKEQWDQWTANAQATLIQTATLTAANTENAFSLYTVWQRSQEAAAAINDQTAATEEASHKTVDITAEVKAFTDALDAQAKATYDAANALGVMDSLAEQLRPIDLAPRGGDRATGAAADLERTGSALDSVLGIFKELDALGQKGGEAGSIAENLVGKPGEMAPIDDMLKRGVISLTRYNETVAAGYRIEARQKSIEEELNVVRAKQLPLLDEQDKAFQRQLKDLEHMSPVQQEVALGFMDTNEAMKSQQAIALAAAAANGELGEQGEKAARRIINGAIEADPVLKEMLKSIGLVTEDKDGTIHIHFPKAQNLHEDLTKIHDDIQELIDVLGDMPGDVHTHVHVDGTEDAKTSLDDVSGKLDHVDGRQVFAAVGLDGAEDVKTSLDQVIGKLNEVDGRHATSTIDIVTNNIVNDVKGGDTNAPSHGMLGGALGYALGGTVTRARLGEAGPEVVALANGGRAIAWTDGIYGLTSGAFVTPSPQSKQEMRSMGGGGIVFNNYGDIHGFAGLDDFMAAAARSLRSHMAGMGA